MLDVKLVNIQRDINMSYRVHNVKLTVLITNFRGLSISTEQWSLAICMIDLSEIHKKLSSQC